MSLVIFAVGNPSRGDDALGPALMARLAGLNLPDVQLVEDFQLQIEHALDLEGRELALFIDADLGSPPPFRFEEIHPAARAPAGSHALEPGDVLRVATQIGLAAPPSFILGVEGEHFCLGEGLSPGARLHMEAAWTHLVTCLTSPRADHWRTLVSARSAAVSPAPCDRPFDAVHTP